MVAIVGFGAEGITWSEHLREVILTGLEVD